jgi:sulfonate transport system substrate-binding protein
VVLAGCGPDAPSRAADAPSPTTATTTAAVTSTADTAVADSSVSSSVSSSVGSAASPTSTTDTAAVAVTPATDPPTAVTAPRVPDGVTIRIGDQLDYLKTLLSLSGQDQGFPYTIEYSAFVGGPPMLQAFQAGALDAGFIGTTPLIFAQAAGIDLVGVAAWASSEHSAYSLVTAPGNTDINGWADLKGKTVAYQKGTAGEAVLLQALDAVGLKESDITTVDVPQVSVTATLEGGSADAALQVEPLTSAYLAADPTARSVIKADKLTDRSAVLISTKDALADAGKSAAIADYITRLVRAYAYLRDHQDELATAVYVKTYGLTPERAAALTKENGVTDFYAVPGDLLGPQQHLADLFAGAGQIPSKLDVSSSFDTRFNDLVLATQATS